MEEKEKTLDISSVLDILWQYKILIAVLGIVCMLFMFVKTAFFTADTYAANARIYVSSFDEVDSDQMSMIYGGYDIESSRILSVSYIEILKSRSFLNKVSQGLDSKYSADQLAGMISITPINETEILVVTVHAGNGYDAYRITKEVVDNADAQLKSIFKQGGAKIVDAPIRPTGPVSRGTVRNTALGLVAGVLLGVVIAFVLNSMDRKVHDAASLTERYGITVLGELEQC